MSFSGIGVDLVEIKRFAKANSAIGTRFISNVFTKHEETYCRAFKDAAPHFAGTFAAKEAACKAFGGAHALNTFEIRRTGSGKPEVWKNKKKLTSLAISISHDGAYAVAVCIAI